MELSPKALQIIEVVFSDKSNLQMPVGVAEQVVEIRQWVKEKLENTKKDV